MKFGLLVLSSVIATSRAFMLNNRISMARNIGRSFCTAGDETTADDAPKGEFTELSRLEIRVGKIVEIDTHPEADTLFVEKVDVGEEDGPRTIVSGLVEYCNKEDLLNRDVIVLCNLKPRALKGITSAGMLLCASNKEDSKVDPLTPPAGSEIGDLITFEGHTSEFIAPGNRASKAFSKIADDLSTNAAGEATYKGIPFMTNAGACTSVIKDGNIS